MREEVFACDDYSTADWNSQTTTAAAGPLEDGDDLPGTFINPTVTFAVNISRKTKHGLTFYPFCSSLQLQCENLRQQPRVDFNSQKIFCSQRTRFRNVVRRKRRHGESSRRQVDLTPVK